MADLQDILEVKELRDVDEVNKLLESGDWELLTTAPGQRDDYRAYILYCLGRPYKEKVPETWL